MRVRDCKGKERRREKGERKEKETFLKVLTAAASYWYTPLMTTTVAQRIELNKASTILGNGLTAMEITAVSDAAQTNSFPFEAVMLVRSRLGLGLSDAKDLLRKTVSFGARWF